MRRVLALGAFGIWGHSQGSVAWGVHARLPSMQKSGIMVGEAREDSVPDVSHAVAGRVSISSQFVDLQLPESVQQLGWRNTFTRDLVTSRLVKPR